MVEVEKLSLTSLDVSAERIDQLRHLFPEVFFEGKIDHDALHRALGQWIDPGKERFGLNWPGKAECIRVIQSPSVGTLLPAPEESVNFDTSENLIVEGDNLEVLKLLQKSYYGKVKMIYIDPPYNTGNEFIYTDNYREGLDEYLKFSGQVDAEGYKTSTNTETEGRYHSKWLSMMHPRLFLSKNLLRDDGVIFVSIDDNEVHNLRALMNEVFGEENFVANVVWQKKYAVSNDDPGIAPMHDHIIIYQRSERFERNLLPRTEKQISRYTNIDNDPRGDWSSDNYVSNKSRYERPTLWYPIRHPKTGEDVWPEESAVWRYSQEKHSQIELENRLYWGPDLIYKRPRLKRFLSEVQDGIVPSTWWPFTEVGHNDEGQKETAALIGPKVFSTPKPARLIRRMIEIGTGKNDLIMDFFAGSGATAQAVLDLNKEDNGNRKFILVQLPEKTDNKEYPTIAHITRERVHRVIKKLHDADAGRLDLNGAAKQDRGFKSFHLSSSNFKVWDGDAAKVADVGESLALFTDNIIAGRSQNDILFELLLKAGFPLTAPLEKLTLAEKEVFSVDNGKLLICLDKELTLQVIEVMVARGPRQILCLDEGFKGNDQLKVNAVQTVKSRNRREDSDIVFRVV
ncbi:MAG: site-specific DNA-methyltransferase [Geobacteraceae bacterium]|nr:site-specific DNA-methyltransferase [Geobacteraceae bacterium]